MRCTDLLDRPGEIRATMIEKEPYDQEVRAARAIHAGIDRYSESMGRSQSKYPTCGNELVEQVEVTIDFRGGTSTPTLIR